MSRAIRLTPEEKDFFTLVARVIFSNPFSSERDQVEALLGPHVRFTRRPRGHHFAELVPSLRERLGRLAERGAGDIQAVQDEDRRLVEYAHLFDRYHHYTPALDRLIEEQIVRGPEPAPLPFAQDLLRELRERGFPIADTHRYIALFFQLRRAFHFIDRSLVGDAPCMKRLRHALWNSVFTADVRTYSDCLWERMEDFSTLLLGETGTGKGSAAAAVGRSGLIPFDPHNGRFAASFTETFIATNLSQFPESLIESELFGHRKGAFTGAIDHHKGVLERCSAHGSLFLDEIGDVSAQVQIKLLNVLQDRNFSPVGGHQMLRFRGRVIAASNRSLETLRRDGRFRDDFFYRLSSNVIEVPPLRLRLQESPHELEQLTASLLQRMTGEAGGDLLARVMDALQRLPDTYLWPGNVRELEQAVRRVLLNGQYRPDGPAQPTRPAWLAAAESGALTAQELLGQYCRTLYQALGSYEEVARRTALDRRTVKKHAESVSW
jgi:sigma-54 specific flagellar transcriptional regulator A